MEENNRTPALKKKGKGVFCFNLNNMIERDV